MQSVLTAEVPSLGEVLPGTAALAVQAYAKPASWQGVLTVVTQRLFGFILITPSWQ